MAASCAGERLPLGKATVCEPGRVTAAVSGTAAGGRYPFPGSTRHQPYSGLWLQISPHSSSVKSPRHMGRRMFSSL